MANLDFLYGRNAVREALLSGRRRIYRLHVAAGATPGGALGDILRLAAKAGIPIQEVDRAQLDRMAGTANHHGVMAEASPYVYLSVFDLLARLKAKQAPALVLILDYLQDPQNLGTLVRSAEAVAADAIIIPQHRAAGITPAVVSASAGATEHMSICDAPNLVRTLKELKDAGLWIIGLEKEEGAPLYTQVDLRGPLGLVVGGEGKGMSRLVKETCDSLMQLPMAGKVDSLNAAVAGSIALYEVWRQRSAAEAGKH